MKLSQKIIIRKIEQHLANSVDFSGISTSLTLKRPVFAADLKQWPDAAVCIAEELPPAFLTMKMPKRTLLLLKQKALPAALPRDRCFLLKESCSLPRLFNTLQELFDTYEDWEENIQQALNREDTIQSLLDLSYPIFRNPLLLKRADFFILAHSSVIEENPALGYLIDPVNTYETITLCKTDSVFLNALNERGPYFLPDYLAGTRELCCNLFDHGVFSYRLILVEELSEIREEMGPVLQHLSEYVQILLRRTAQNSQMDVYPLENLLKDIISKKQTDYTFISTALSEFGWYPNHSYCCMTARMSSMGSQNMTSNYLCKHFENIIPGSCAFRYEGAIVVFVNLARYDNTIDGLLNSTIEFLRDSFLKTGISNSVISVMDLRYCYIQAKIALEYGSKYQTFRWVHKFEDITMQYFMECCLADLPVHMVCSSSLLALKEHDRVHHSDFYNTLKVYLDSHLNAVQSARKLFIHRSTFLYRLEKIQELVHINFDDQDQLFYLLISYRILELKETDSSDLTVLQQ